MKMEMNCDLMNHKFQKYQPPTWVDDGDDIIYLHQIFQHFLIIKFVFYYSQIIAIVIVIIKLSNQDLTRIRSQMKINLKLEQFR